MTGPQTPGRTDRTYIEDAKKPVKVLHPSSNLTLIVLHGDHSGKSFTLLGEFPPDLGHSSAIERSVSGSPGVHIRYCGSRSQTSNRMENGLVEFIQLSPIQSPIECLTYTSTSPPELNTIPIVGHRVLDRPESSQVRFRRVAERTLIIAKRVLAEPKATRACGMSQVSFARFKAWVSTSNVKRAPSSPSGCWNAETIVGISGRGQTRCQEEPEPQYGRAVILPRVSSLMKKLNSAYVTVNTHFALDLAAAPLVRCRVWSRASHGFWLVRIRELQTAHHAG